VPWTTRPRRITRPARRVASKKRDEMECVCPRRRRWNITRGPNNTVTIEPLAQETKMNLGSEKIMFAKNMS
jgi:hypothetical protein